MGNGRFIAFEGIEGSGKSTQLQLLKAHLETQGRDVVALREPGGTAVGDRIRAVLLDAELGPMADPTEMLLFAAARSQIVREKIRPALAEDRIVLCDRFLHSSLAYQAHARGLGREQVMAVNQPATEGLLPDRVVLLDLEPRGALERARARGKLDRIEAESLAFHQAVRAGFLAEAELEPGRFVIVDGDRPPDEIHRDIVEELEL